MSSIIGLILGAILGVTQVKLIFMSSIIGLILGAILGVTQVKLKDF